MPCPEIVLARWFRERMRERVEATTCVSLKARSWKWQYPDQLIPPPAALTAASFPLVEPLVPATWNGIFFGTC
jgi:hypothetical protein